MVSTILFDTIRVIWISRHFFRERSGENVLILVCFENAKSVSKGPNWQNFSVDIRNGKICIQYVVRFKNQASERWVLLEKVREAVWAKICPKKRGWSVARPERSSREAAVPCETISWKIFQKNLWRFRPLSQCFHGKKWYDDDRKRLFNGLQREPVCEAFSRKKLQFW